MGAVIVSPIPFSDPAAAFSALRRAGEMAVLLDSAATEPGGARYSYVAVDPVRVVRTDWTDAFAQLESLLARLPQWASPPDWPFAGGLIGSFGYELRRAIEQVPSRHPQEDGPADLVLGLFDTIVAFDRIAGRAAILAVDIDPARPTASIRAASLATRLAQAPDLPPVGWATEASWRADWTDQAYRRQVETVRDYIRAGDIYQVNFTQRWMAARPEGLEAFELHRRLTRLSPAPYAAFIDDGMGNAILSASPERFLAVSPDGWIDTQPIKGTRPRGRTQREDDAEAAALSASAKDRAENLMIVDLLRNDLGRVARTGSVAVPQLNVLTSFASVHHLVSRVTARLKPECRLIDLIRASFPGGSVTGAPKVRAMEIIDELEVARRGPYCGAIGWIGFDRAMELSIAIRTLVVTPRRVIAQAGGGIVADSDSAAEHAEAQTKARALLACLDPAFREGPIP